MTAFAAKEVKKWAALHPLIDEVGGLFKRYLAKKHAVQMAYAEKCSPDFRIKGTPFSTMILFDPHEWHGVTDLVHADPDNEGDRITVVYYFRQGLSKCGSAAEELAKAKGKGAIE